MILNNPWAKIGIIAATLAIGFIAGYKVSDNSWQTKWANAERDAATEQLNAVNTAVKDYKDKLTKLEDIEHDTRLALSNALLDAANADAANYSLQQQLSNYVRNASRRADNAATAAERAAIATDFVVLTELFNRANRRAEELAKVADERRTRGLACEAAYGVLQERW